MSYDVKKRAQELYEARKTDSHYIEAVHSAFSTLDGTNSWLNGNSSFMNDLADSPHDSVHNIKNSYTYDDKINKLLGTHQLLVVEVHELFVKNALVKHKYSDAKMGALVPGMSHEAFSKTRFRTLKSMNAAGFIELDKTTRGYYGRHGGIHSTLARALREANPDLFLTGSVDEYTGAKFGELTKKIRAHIYRRGFNDMSKKYPSIVAEDQDEGYAAKYTKHQKIYDSCTVRLWEILDVIGKSPKLLNNQTISEPEAREGKKTLEDFLPIYMDLIDSYEDYANHKAFNKKNKVKALDSFQNFISKDIAKFLFAHSIEDRILTNYVKGLLDVKKYYDKQGKLTEDIFANRYYTEEPIRAGLLAGTEPEIKSLIDKKRLKRDDMIVKVGGFLNAYYQYDGLDYRNVKRADVSRVFKNTEDQYNMMYAKIK